MTVSVGFGAAQVVAPRGAATPLHTTKDGAVTILAVPRTAPSDEPIIAPTSSS